MASNSFKVKNSLVLTPKDLSTLTSPEAGDLACDINDNNKIKRYDADLSAWVEVGSGGGVGGVDIFFVQDFESASLNSFTQDGLELSQADTLKGRVSAKLVHDASVNKFFKQVIPVDAKFRGQAMTLRLDSKSSASQGNLTIKIYDETNAADIVASEQLQLENDVNGKKTSVGFIIPETCESLSYTITALPEAGSPESIIDDIICELAQTEVIQSGLVQEEDSEFDSSNNNGSSVTALVTDINYLNPVISGDIGVWSNNRLKVSKDGIYEISATAFFTSGTFRNLAVFINGVIERYLTTSASASFSAGSTSLKLKKDDEISIRTNVTSTLSPSPDHKLTITYQGSLKQVSVNPNSKITIPTSELRFEGASSRGSVATTIVKFDTLAKIRGDAFEVVSNSSDGTYIQMKKAGKLGISCTLVNTTSNNSSPFITLNQSDLTTTAFSSERLAGATFGNSAGGSIVQNTSWDGFVKVGDILRISSGVNPTANTANNLNLSFQEQEIAVSVSNTLPQFSESDSCVQLSGANGFGSTATTTRRFANVLQNIGTDIEYVDSPTLGGQFIAKSAGIYHVSYSETSSSNTAILRASISVNGVIVNQDGNIYNTSSTQQKNASPSWSGFLDAGDIVTAFVPAPVEANGAASFFTISKVGKPNVTGVDVTPFVNIPQPESQSSRIEQSVLFTGPVTITGALVKSVGSSIYTYNPSTGFYTALKKAKVQVSASIRQSSTTNLQVIVSSTVQGDLAVNTSDSSNQAWVSTAIEFEVLPGESFYVRSETSGGTDVQKITVLAEALSDQILTAPETFSTDTASLQYAPSSQYTLSTLENAPVGTYITFTYAANTNTRTQTTTAPTQSTADMNANGIRIFTRAYNAPSSAAQPAAIAIQIGKGLKGVSQSLYRSAGKVTAGRLDLAINSTSTTSGLSYRDYNENTGILYVDAAKSLNGTDTVRIFDFNDLTGETSGYLVINASKNPALTGMNIPRAVGARYTSNSGQAIGTSDTVIKYEDLQVDTDSAYNTGSGVYVVPEDGWYHIEARVLTATVSLTTGQALDMYIKVNNTNILNARTRGTGSTTVYNVAASGTVKLIKNDQIIVYARSNTSTTLNSTSDIGWSNFSIIKVK